MKSAVELSEGAGESLEEGDAIGANAESFPQPVKTKAASRIPNDLAEIGFNETRDLKVVFITL